MILMVKDSADARRTFRKEPPPRSLSRRRCFWERGGRPRSPTPRGLQEGGKRAAEGAGRAREDKGTNAGRDGLLQEIERACDVGIDEVLPSVREDMGFMQGRRMEDCVHTLHAPLHMRAVDYRPDLARKA